MKKLAWLIGLVVAMAGLPVFAKTVLIDVRTSAEYAQEHLDGALNIDYTVIGRDITSAGVDKDDTVILYCRTGNRSGIALQTLKAMGFSRVENYGGISEARKRLQKHI